MSSKTTEPLEPRDIGRINYVGLATLIKKEIGRFTTVYMQTLVAPVVTTLLFYTVFALAFGGVAREIGGIPFLKFLAPGLIMMAMVQNAFANTSSSIVISKVQGTFIDLLMPPLSSMELLIGFVVGGMARGLLVGLVTGIVMHIFVPMSFTSVGAVILFALLGTLMLSAMGTVAGLWSEKFDHMSAVTNFIITPLTFLSGTFYSIESLPDMWHGIALYNPFFYMIDGFRGAFIGHMDGNLMTGVVFLVVVDVFLLVLIYAMLRTGYKIKS